MMGDDSQTSGGLLFRPNQALTIEVGEPIIISSQAERPDALHIHPKLIGLSESHLLCSISRERDVHDQERFWLESFDAGRTWKPCSWWPVVGLPGSYPGVFCGISQKNWLVCWGDAFAASEPGLYHLPSWKSVDGGATWSSFTGQIRFPFGRPKDIYDPNDPWRKERPDLVAKGFVKPLPPASLEPWFKEFGHRRIPALHCVMALTDGALLGLIHGLEREGAKRSIYALRSEDGGGHWKFLGPVAVYSPAVEAEFASSRPADGFTEPSLLRLPNGRLRVMLRMGSHYPLYTSLSKDQGETWTPPQRTSLQGILPSCVRLENGLVLLASGRPDTSLNVSFDEGNTWPATFRLMEGGYPGYEVDLPSTRNNSMVRTGPGEIFYACDQGGWRPEFKGERKVIGLHVKVTTR